MDPSERHALLHLIAIGGALAPRRGLLQRYGSARAVGEAGLPAWRAAGMDLRQCQALATRWSPTPEVVHWCEADAPHHLLGFSDVDYPPLLREMAEPPLALFVAGDPACLWHPALAMVGSRRPSAGGQDNARAFASAIVRAGLAVTSGLAAGIDGTAHRAALEAGGLTIAVLGTGISDPYPRQHTHLYHDIIRHGAVVSEYLPGTPPRRGHFPARNRIIAGLSLGTLVVEAAQRSGALISARLAADSGREVFAIPGSIHNPMSKGCHRLIRQGASLVETPDEIIQVLAPLAARLGQALRQRLETQTGCHNDSACLQERSIDTPELRHLWQALGHDPVALDQLAERTGLAVAELSAQLLLLELDGRITCAHGRYSRIMP